MAAVADRYIPSASTFNALTRDYIYGYVENNIWLDTALLTYFRNKINWITGRSEQPLIEYARASNGGWYGRGEVVDSSVLHQLAADIETRAKFSLYRYRQPIVLDSWDTDAQGAQAIVKLFNEYVQSVMEGMRTDLGSVIFNGNNSTDADQPDGLDRILDDTLAWGGISPTDTGYEFWRPHFMEGTSTYSVAVAPSLQNHELMIRRIRNTTRQKPTLIVVAEALYDVLAAQIDPADRAVSQRKSDELYNWGFDYFKILGVPVVEDLGMLGSAWVSGQSTRATAAGYQSLFLNLNKLWLSANRQRSFKWDPAGWRRPTDLDGMLNFVYAWIGFAGNNRRAQGRIWNMDITMDLDDMAAVGAGTVTRPVAST